MLLVNRPSGFFYHLRVGVALSLLFVLANYLFSAAEVYQSSRTRPVHHADAAVVLGAAAWGKRPSPVFRERLNHAIYLYHTNMVDKLIFTGGTPKPGFMTEAAVGRRYALQNGVDPADILYENTSRDTYQNLVNTRILINNNNIDSIIIVSDPYHMARAAMMARDLGLNVQTSPTPTTRFTATQSKLRFLAQESYMLMVYRWVQTAKHIVLHMRKPHHSAPTAARRVLPFQAA